MASVELIDLQSAGRLKAETSDVSVYGCRIQTDKPLPVGTKLRLRIVRSGVSFVALAKVAFAAPLRGMGVVFSHIEAPDQAILDRWIAELRTLGVSSR